MIFHQVLALALRNHGIRTMFGLIGDGNLFIVDSFTRQQGKYVSFAQESGAVLAAGAYSQVTNSVGVATVTHGPGLTNTVTALIENVKGHTPLLLITGDTPAEDRRNIQNVDQRAVVLSAGGGFEQTRSPNTVEADLSEAIRRALAERRPVVLNVPAEYLWLDVPLSNVLRGPASPQYADADPAVLDDAVGYIASAQRPVIIAGRGAIDPGSRDAILRLADALGAPVATTLRAKNLFRGYRYDLGICGTLSDPSSSEAIAKSDCIIVFGAGMHSRTTMAGELVRPDKVIHVSDTVTDLNQWESSRLGILGHPSCVASRMCEMLELLDTKPSRYAAEVMAPASAGTVADPRDELDGSGLNIRATLRKLEASFPSSRSLVIDGGRVLRHAYPVLSVESPAHYVHSFSSGAIGLGMGTAIGAAAACPERPVLLVCGDGSFMLDSLGEFNTAVRHQMDVTVVVLNDGSYGAEYVQFERRGLAPGLSVFSWPDFAAVACALGGQGMTASTSAELDRALAAIEGRDRPMLIDIKLNPSEISM